MVAVHKPDEVEVVNVHEAKTHLSRLLARIEAGEEIIIARAGKPVARLVAADKKEEKPPPRRLGMSRDKIFMTEDAFDPLPDDWWNVFREDDEF